MANANSIQIAPRATQPPNKLSQAKLSIVKLKLQASLKTAAPDSQNLATVPPSSSDQFYTDLDAAIARCTPKHIQDCKHWIIQHIAPSKARLALLGDYLVALSEAVAADTSKSQRARTWNPLRILFVVSDVLHAEKHHRQAVSTGDQDASPAAEAKALQPRPEDDGTFGETVGQGLEPCLARLVALAALQCTEPHSKAELKLKSLLQFWRESDVLTPQYITDLEETAGRALDQAQGRRGVYTLPTWFGGQNSPWHCLPASYMLMPLAQHPDRAIYPRDLQPVRFNKTEPSNHVCDLLDEYFDNIDLEFAPNSRNPTGGTEKYNLWLDPMGQMVKGSKETGERKTVCNGWGWSMKMCDEMKEQKVPETIRKLREEQQTILKSRETSKENTHGEKRPASAGSCSEGDNRPRSQQSSSSSLSNEFRQQRRRHQSPRDYDRDFDDRRRKSRDAMDIDRPRSRPNRFDERSAMPHFNGSRTDNHVTNISNPNVNLGQQYPPPPQTAQGFQPPSGFQPPYPLPPHAPRQFSGQPGMQPYPPPPPPFSSQFQPGPGGPSHSVHTSQFNGPHSGFSNYNGVGNDGHNPNNAYGNGNGNPYSNNRHGSQYTHYDSQRGGYGGPPPQHGGYGGPSPQRGSYGGSYPNRGNRGNQRGRGGRY